MSAKTYTDILTASGGDPPQNADHRRAVPLAATGGKRESIAHDKLREFAHRRKPVSPPGRWRRRARSVGCEANKRSQNAPNTLGRPSRLNATLKRPGRNAGDDFVDNREPGEDFWPGGLDHRTGIRQPLLLPQPPRNKEVQRMWDVVVTHEFPMSEAEEAFKISASQLCGKILLYPHRQ